MSKIKLDNNPMLNPVPIIIVGTTANGRANYTTVGAFGVVCLEPIFYISLKNTHCSTAAIRESGFFSVNLSTPALIQKTDYCGMVSGNTVDKSNVFTACHSTWQKIRNDTRKTGTLRFYRDKRKPFE